MPVTPEQLQTFKSVFGADIDEGTIDTFVGLHRTIVGDEKTADALGIASKAAPPDPAPEASATTEKADADGDGVEDAPTEEAETEVAGEFIGDMSPDAFRALMTEIITGAMAGSATKAQVDPAVVSALKAEIEQVKSQVGKTDPALLAKVTTLETRLKALVDDSTSKQVAAQIYDPTKDPNTITTSAALKAADPADNDVVNWLLS